MCRDAFTRRLTACAGRNARARATGLAERDYSASLGAAAEARRRSRPENLALLLALPRALVRSRSRRRGRRRWRRRRRGTLGATR